MIGQTPGEIYRFAVHARRTDPDGGAGGGACTLLVIRLPNQVLLLHPRGAVDRGGADHAGGHRVGRLPGHGSWTRRQRPGPEGTAAVTQTHGDGFVIHVVADQVTHIESPDTDPTQ